MFYKLMENRLSSAVQHFFSFCRHTFCTSVYSLNHNAYVMPELVETTKTMLLQDLSHHYKVLWSLFWIRGLLWCIHLYHENGFVDRVVNFLSSFVYSGLDILWATSQVFFCKSMGRLPRCNWSILPLFSGVRLALLFVFLCTCYFMSCVCLFSSVYL